MKIKWILLKISLFIIMLITLISFSNSLNSIRELNKIETSINYENGNHFINNTLVDSLLKKTHPDYPKMTMQKVRPEKMEKYLKENEFIAQANVYIENNGVLHTEIEQEIPVARVKNENSQYYITQSGKKINLSPYFSANTLLVNGKINKNDYKKIIQLTYLINKDDLLKNHVIGLSKLGENSFNLLVDDSSYYLELGKLDNLENKLDNYKVFYEKFILQTKENPYKKLNLKFNNQIVATK